MAQEGDRMNTFPSYLYQSCEAWNRCNSAIHDAKAAVREEDKQALEFVAAMWRVKYETLQALYWCEVKP